MPLSLALLRNGVLLRPSDQTPQHAYSRITEEIVLLGRMAVAWVGTEVSVSDIRRLAAEGTSSVALAVVLGETLGGDRMGELLQQAGIAQETSVLATAVSLARHGCGKDEIQKVGYCPLLASFFAADDFEHALIGAFNGSDNPSEAGAAVGAVAGAAYGVQRNMRKAVLAFLPLEMRDSVIGFEKRLESRGNNMDRMRRVNELKARLWGKSVRDGHTQFGGETVERFLKAQEGVWEIVLPELRAGEKRGHWMWYVFPQIVGLGQSSMATRYAIRDLEEAREYLAHPVLGARLRDAMATVLAHCGKKTAEDIFMELDAMKLKSCATLFDLVEPGGIFAEVLGAFYGGVRCERTLEHVSWQGLRGDFKEGENYF